MRAIDAIVESMEILTLDFKYSETASTGRKPYSPIDMFKLYTYSYFNGIRSSRKIERECSRNIELMWLISNLAPDFKTIADFRKNNREAIKKAFSKFSMICDSLGLISKEMVAVDGSKFRANNSSDQYCTAKKTAKKIEHYEEQAKKYLVLLDANDEQEKEKPPPSFNKRDLKQKLDGIQKRISELKELQAEIEENGDIALIDPDSKMMQVKNSGREVSHNVQIAVDSKNHAENKEMVRLRKCLAEHPFGTLKRAFGFGYFLTRRTENVRTETLLHFLTYNIKRVINIMGTQKLRAVMQG